MESDKELSECFRAVGDRYGYDRTFARYADFRDLKVRWQRTSDVIEFNVSDYLRDVPDETMRQLADTLFAKIAGERRGYPPGLENWIGRREFADKHRPVYLSRCRKVTTDPEGTWKNLDDVLRRLKESKLITGEEDIKVVWTAERTFRRYAHCSVVMRVVVVSNEMDEESVPDYVLDWIVYNEYCHIMAGFDPNDPMKCEDEAELASRYPMRAKAEWWLREKEDQDRRDAESELRWGRKSRCDSSE